jgi:sulfur carrier protein
LRLIINGDDTELPDGLALDGLVNSLGLKPALIAIEVNGRIIRRANWNSTSLSEGDKVEIVHFVGGG